MSGVNANGQVGRGDMEFELALWDGLSRRNMESILTVTLLMIDVHV